MAAKFTAAEKSTSGGMVETFEELMAIVSALCGLSLALKDTSGNLS